MPAARQSRFRGIPGTAPGSVMMAVIAVGVTVLDLFG